MRSLSPSLEKDPATLVEYSAKTYYVGSGLRPALDINKLLNEWMNCTGKELEQGSHLLMTAIPG